MSEHRTSDRLGAVGPFLPAQPPPSLLCPARGGRPRLPSHQPHLAELTGNLMGTPSRNDDGEPTLSVAQSPVPGACSPQRPQDVGEDRPGTRDGALAERPPRAVSPAVRGPHQRRRGGRPCRDVVEGSPATSRHQEGPAHDRRGGGPREGGGPPAGGPPAP